MKNENLIKLMFCLMLPLVLLSCIADDSIRADQNNTAKIEQLRKDILGKWTFETKNLRTTDNSSLIEFLKDGMFLVKLSNGQVFSDKYSILGPSEIALDNFGEISNILLQEDQINFKLIYEKQVVPVNANRINSLIEKEKTQLLCRKWQLTNQEDGRDSANAIDRAFTTFFDSGTYLTEGYSKTSQQGWTETLNWKWHSTMNDRIVYWKKNDKIEEDKKYMIIRELTPSILKTTESTFWGLRNYVFIPAN